MEYTNQLKKYIRSLHVHKYRQKYNKFIAEGPKICNEFLQSTYNISHIICTSEWATNSTISSSFSGHLIIVKQAELQQLSTLNRANQVLCLIDRPEKKSLTCAGWMLYLDKIQDPGNMGTIIRTADWFGITHICISPDTVDVYNPKVIQASMGSHIRHNFFTLEVSELISLEYPLYGLTLNGESIEQVNPSSGFIIVGNESKGIRPELMEKLHHKLTISRLGKAESLNAAVAFGIACHQLIGN